MSFVSAITASSHINVHVDALPLVPSVLHVRGDRRNALTQVADTCHAVYVAQFADNVAYVGYTGDPGSRVGRSSHLDLYGGMRNAFVITDASGLMTEAFARAGERIVWEILRMTGRMRMIGNLPLGEPLGDSYPQARAFFGRALQMVAATGLMLEDIPGWRLLAGFLVSEDVFAPLSLEPPDGILHECNIKMLRAQAVERENGEWVLLRGSHICAQPAPSAGGLLRTRIETLVYSGHLKAVGADRYELQRDVKFSSPSGAIQFVAGSKGYGPHDWMALASVASGKLQPLLP